MADTDAHSLDVHQWIAQFALALERSDVVGACALFAEGGAWRDLLAFTWTIKTLEGRGAIEELLRARLADVAPGNWTVEG